MKRTFLAFTALLLGITACNQTGAEQSIASADTANAEMNTQEKQEKSLPEGTEVAYFASGCFWCVEAIFESVHGVEEAISGYAGGDEKNPTYEQVSRGQTNHTESVKVLYKPEVIDYKTLVKVFYGSHNPTTVNGQAPDFGKQYRSAIFYTSPEEMKIATAFKDSLDASGMYNEPIATEINALNTFWEAEAYHQDYEEKNPNNGYVRNVSVPRLNKFKAKYPKLLKEGH